MVTAYFKTNVRNVEKKSYLWRILESNDLCISFNVGSETYVLFIMLVVPDNSTHHGHICLLKTRIFRVSYIVFVACLIFRFPITDTRIKTCTSVMFWWTRWHWNRFPLPPCILDALCHYQSTRASHLHLAWPLCNLSNG